MNIDRNNYEEYFLLYADNELTDSEKVDVIMFLKNNKDLEKEFLMINHTINKPDMSVGLADNSFLKRNEEFITLKNYEEVFVLYHDNELTINQKSGTQKFLTQHPQLKEEFDLIGLARLIPESAIVFADKNRLYKKEKDGKVIPLFWRVMAAAIFIGFGLWILQKYFSNKKEIPTGIVRLAPTKKTNIIPDKRNVADKKGNNIVAQSSTKNSQPVQPVVNHIKKIQKSLSNKNADNGIAKTFTKSMNPVEEKVNVPIEKENDNVAITNKIKNIPAEQIKSDEKIVSENQLAQNVLQKTTEAAPAPAMHAQTVSYVQDVNPHNDNYVFYDITTEEFRKTKVGGFLKKVKRIIERNNPISRLLGGEDRQVVSN